MTFVVSVLGLKKSGKTTVAAALINALADRGLPVAALKTTHLERLTLDPRGTDSARLLEAGAGFVAVHSRRQTLTLENHPEEAARPDLFALVPPWARLVVAEGLLPPAPARRCVIVCLRGLEELEETLRVRDVQPGEVLALSGVFAGGGPASRAGAGGSASATEAAWPVCDALDPRELEELCGRLLATAGIAAPGPRPPSGG